MKIRFVAEIRSRKTSPFDSPQEAMAEAMRMHGNSWGNTNPEWVHQLSYSKEVKPGQWQHQRSYLVKMSRSGNGDVSIESVHDDQGRQVSGPVRHDNNDLADAFKEHFTKYGMSGKFD